MRGKLAVFGHGCRGCVSVRFGRNRITGTTYPAQCYLRHRDFKGKLIMDSGPRWLLIVAIVVLGLAECGWIGYRTEMRMQADLRASVLPYHRPLPKTAVRRFSHAQVSQFLGRVKQAEAIADPLQRCLAYPDPPASHWSHDAVSAYCNYRFQSIISFSEVQQLIRSGHAAEVDLRLAQALREQSTQVDAHGLLDRTFYQDFYYSSADVRSTLDAWKHDSPNSAFAFAASAAAYMTKAVEARGGAYIRDTPQSQIDAMDRLLSQAEADARRAIELNSQLTPAYSVLIDVGRLGRTQAFVEDVARHGLAAAPADYSIYSALMEAEQPKWGGSLSVMVRLANNAQAHAMNNPLLKLLRTEEPAYEYDICDCGSTANWAAYPYVFDNVASANLLDSAGSAASRNNHPELAVIYLSEALRFLPQDDKMRCRRARDMAAVGMPRMALDEANRLLAANPKDADNYQLRGMVYAGIGDEPHAEQDFEAALAINPDDPDALVPLASIYINNTQEWDKGWDITNRILREQPDSPAGWVMRATIQENQPRPGLDKTYQYFVSHFGNDPGMQWQINHIRQVLNESRQRSPRSIAPSTH